MKHKLDNFALTDIQRDQLVAFIRKTLTPSRAGEELIKELQKPHPDVMVALEAVLRRRGYKYDAKYDGWVCEYTISC